MFVQLCNNNKNESNIPDFQTVELRAGAELVYCHHVCDRPYFAGVAVCRQDRVGNCHHCQHALDSYWTCWAKTKAQLVKHVYAQKWAKIKKRYKSLQETLDANLNILNYAFGGNFLASNSTGEQPGTFTTLCLDSHQTGMAWNVSWRSNTSSY